MPKSIAIVAATRTAIGAFQGQFASLSAPQLGAAVIAQALAQSRLTGTQIDEVLMGNVLSAGLGQAPARQAALGAGLPEQVSCTTLNKVCGSGLKALMLGCDLIQAGSAQAVIAGGMESMTNAPYLLPKARGGYRMGHAELLDHMFFDGLQNPYDGNMMGIFAERCASKYQFSRDAQDAFAATSISRAMQALQSGAFATEITPVRVSSKTGTQEITQDEEPPRCDIARIPSLKPAFGNDGTVTAASASKISDGAAALVICDAALAQQQQLPVLGQVIAHASHAQEPAWFTTAPVGAIQKLLHKTGWSVADVDLFEINEAFAAVTMAAISELGLDPAKVNVHGGACALGHPIGASGARILVTLVHALRAQGKRRGVAALCIGGGEAVAVGVEV